MKIKLGIFLLLSTSFNLSIAQNVLKEYDICIDEVCNGENLLFLSDHSLISFKGSDKVLGIYLINDPSARWEKRSDSLFIVKKNILDLYLTKIAFGVEFLVSEKVIGEWEQIEKRISTLIEENDDVNSVEDPVKKNWYLKNILPILVYDAYPDNPGRIYVEADPSFYVLKKVKKRIRKN